MVRGRKGGREVGRKGGKEGGREEGRKGGREVKRDKRDKRDKRHVCKVSNNVDTNRTTL
jgi:hypothetical protein